MHCSEALLDSCLRIALILVLCIGAAGAGGFLWHAAGDTFLLIVGTAGIALALFLGDAPGAAVALARRMITFADSHVNDLLFHQVVRAALAGGGGGAYSTCRRLYVPNRACTRD